MIQTETLFVKRLSKLWPLLQTHLKTQKVVIDISAHLLGNEQTLQVRKHLLNRLILSSTKNEKVTNGQL